MLPAVGTKQPLSGHAHLSDGIGSHGIIFIFNTVNSDYNELTADTVSVIADT
jgi:hypothetical protein